jgi:GPH family glycoside/pentoside/hexuronide:cation symporter
LRRDGPPIVVKAVYAFGGVVDIFGQWLYLCLMQPVFVGYFKLSPAHLSVAQATARIVDALSDSYVGWRSDNTRTRWGRRRPYMLAGSILAGLALPWLFAASRTWNASTMFVFVLVTACCYAPVLSCFNMPYQSLGAELTADSDERTTIASWRGVVQTLAGIANAWAWWFAIRPWFADADGTPNVARGAMMAGAAAGGLMILAGLANALLVKEPYYALAHKQDRVGFLAMTKQTFACRPFRILLLTLVLFAVPASMVGILGWYVQYYYVLAGRQEVASLYSGLSGTVYSILGAAAIPLASRLARKIGKKSALQWALLAGTLVLGSSFWLYTPAAPFLSVVCHGLFGIVASGFFWVLLPSMLADVVDFDELGGGKRREGAFSSTFSYVLKLGTTGTMLLSGPLVELVGFRSRDAVQAPSTLMALRLMFALIPAAACALAIFALRKYPLARAAMAEIRTSLEARRGSV